VEIVMQKDGSVLILNPAKKKVNAKVFQNKLEIEPYQCKQKISMD
jgi:hypothetical protein